MARSAAAVPRQRPGLEFAVGTEPLRVFISSVMRRSLEDLTRERQAACDAVRSFPLIASPWAFESEPASTKALRDSYLDEVKNCDLLLLIVGRTMTDPVREELVTARDHGKPVLAFAKDLPDREPQANEVLNSLDAKYDKFIDSDDLREKVKAALSEEIRRRARPETQPCRSGDLAGRLRDLARGNSTVRISPIVPPQEYDKFSAVRVTAGSVIFEKHSSGQQVEIPVSSVADILDTGQSKPPMVLLGGRLQWITTRQAWQFFPENPPSPDPYHLGFGHVSPQQGPAVDPLYARLRSAGWEPFWSCRDNIANVVAEGGQVYYGEDGEHVTSGKLVLCVRRRT